MILPGDLCLPVLLRIGRFQHLSDFVEGRVWMSRLFFRDRSVLAGRDILAMSTFGRVGQAGRGVEIPVAIVGVVRVGRQWSWK